MGMGEAALRIRRVTERSESPLPDLNSCGITNANKNNYMPAGLRGRAK